MLTGGFILLAALWLVLIEFQLWRAWLRERYATALEDVARMTGLELEDGVGPSLAASGRRQGVRVRVRWRGGSGPHRLVVVARRRWRYRCWVARPDTPVEEVAAGVQRLVEAIAPKSGG